MFMKKQGSDSTLRSLSNSVTGGLLALLLLASVSVAQAQSSADSWVAVVTERTPTEMPVTADPVEGTYWQEDAAMPTVEQHEVETRLVEVEGDLESSINEDLQRLEEATRPPRPKVDQHEVETRLIGVEGDLEASIDEDLERLNESTLPPRPNVQKYEVENRLIEVEGDLETSIERDLERLENDNWIASWERVPLGF